MISSVIIVAGIGAADALLAFSKETFGDIGTGGITFLGNCVSAPDEGLARTIGLDDCRASREAVITKFRGVAGSAVIDRHEPIGRIPFEGPVPVCVVVIPYGQRVR